MKLDKETLYKHRFWITLGVIAFLMFIAATWLNTDVTSELAELQAKIKAHRERLMRESKAPQKGEAEKKVLDDKIALLNVRRGEVWAESWKAQNPEQGAFIVWPDRVKKQKELSEQAFGFKDIENNLVLDYVRKDSYHNQFDDGKGGGIVNLFKVEIPGTKTVLEPVFFKDDWKKMLRYVTWNDHPTVEELWLAQEDFWVNRELLQSLKAANDSISRYVLVENKAKPEEKDGIARAVFENRYWKLDLTLLRKDGKASISGKMTNISDKRQPLGKIYFRVRVHEKNAEPLLIEVQGEPRGAKEEWVFTERPLLGVLDRNPDGIYDVEQIWDPQTSPIRRIDQIALFYNSHRTYEAKPLERPNFSDAGSAIPVADVPAGVEKDQDATMDRTENKLVRTRYYDKTSQVRRMPLGMVLIVDQAHIPEVLTALANSKLHFQTTQVNWQHFYGALAKPVKDDAGRERPGDEVKANNLVELSIYGIASLYDRPGKTEEPPPPPVKPVKKKN